MFNIFKTVSLCSVIIDAEHNREKINYTKLIKIVYLCDRLMLKEHKKFITGDNMYSLPLGPVPEKLYQLICDNKQTKKYTKLGLFDASQVIWNQHYETAGYEIKRIKTPENNKLGKQEMTVTQSVIEAFIPFEWHELVEYTHKYLPEWENPRGSSVPIRPEQILAAPG